MSEDILGYLATERLRATKGQPCPSFRHNGRVIVRATAPWWHRTYNKYAPHIGAAQVARRARKEAANV